MMLLLITCLAALFVLTMLAIGLRRRRLRDAEAIMRRERAMVALAEINRDLHDEVIPSPSVLHAQERPSGNVHVLNANRLHPSLRAPSRRRRTRSHPTMKRQPPDLTNRPTVACLPSLPGASN